MPLTDKGEKIMKAMKSQYGDKHGEQVFYASKNAGKIQGVEGLEGARRKRGQMMRRFAENLARQNRGK